MQTCRRAWRAPLLALLAALAATLAVASAASAAPTPITTGAGLDWGLKASWRTYIGTGGTTASDGAAINVDGTFHFPVTGGAYEPTTRTTTVQFGGTVVFLGHCEGAGGPYARPCALDMTLSDPRVELTEDGGFLYAKMASRPIEGGEIVDLPDVKVAALDIEPHEPATAGGVTTWSDLAATMTPEGSTVFTYPIGTALDPVSFGYTGPGGKPAGEEWSPAGLADYSSQDLAAGAVVPTRLLPGFGGGETVARTDFGLTVVDAETLAPKGANATASIASVRDFLSVDPATKTVFGLENGGTRRLFAYTWDGTALTGGTLPDSAVTGVSADPTLQGAGAWDPVGQRYLAVRTFSDHQDLWQVKRVDGVWTPTRIGTLTNTDGTTWTGKIASLASIPNGMAAGVWGGGPILRVYTLGSSARVAPLTQGAGIEAAMVFRTDHGVYAFSDYGIAWFPIVANVLQTPAAPVTFPQGGPYNDLNRFLEMLTVDPSRDTLYAGVTGNTRLARIEAGVLKPLVPVPGAAGLTWFDHYLAGTAPDGDLLLSAVNSGTVSKLTYRTTTPSFTTQPEDTAVTVTTHGGSTTATFTAAVAGDPAPTVRWQSRRPGATGWADLADGPGVTGATTGTLGLAVSADDGGRQFRAVAKNGAGELASTRVTLDVKTPPHVSVAPTSVAVAEGASARFQVMPTGNPDPAVQWQQRIGGFWREVADDSGDLDVSGGTLVVNDANADMTGTQFRARLRNEVATVYTSPVTLTVTRRVTEAVTFGGGHVDWGVSQRWRCYVVGNVARGGIDVAGGVERIPDTLASGSLCAGRTAGSEALRFPVKGGTYDPASGRLEVRLGGTVRFWGHDYHVPGNTTPQLDTTFANLRLVAEGARGTLYADTVGATMEHPEPVARTNVPLVSVDLTGASPVSAGAGLGWNDLPSVLTEEGSAVFGSYPAGEPFDPLTLALDYGTPQVDPVLEPPAIPTTPAPPAPPAPTAPTTPAKPAAKATVSVAKAARRPNAKRLVTLATVACPKTVTAACRVAVPRTVRVAIGGRRYALAASAPAKVRPGARGTVRLRLTPAAARRLKGRTATVRVAVATTVGGVKATRVVTPRITARR
jgi:hypothetical protein